MGSADVTHPPHEHKHTSTRGPQPKTDEHMGLTHLSTEYTTDGYIHIHISI
jgi:hypothetical protein